MSKNNILLSDLVEPAAMKTISMWPEAMGWKVLLGLLLLGFTLFVIKLYIRWKKNAYRREAIHQLTHLTNELQCSGAITHQIIQQMNQVVKQAASVAYGRKSVAKLYGDEWYQFLNACFELDLSPEFLGRLNQAQFARSEPSIFMVEEGLALSERYQQWVLKHGEQHES
ncbi:DUF4381 domain-containing protein [Vibrio sp. Vb339]|uniref:DUF4381 domain-containing protein n=1 Tax=Vibrio sp. Vb339 TaxID=1192013 RepID=UPI001557C2F3|nr:DUF4381 domain-containing protein [Vibrio sp. Vb339]